MTETARKFVPRGDVWNAFVDGIKNGLTAEEVAVKAGMKLGTFNAAMNKIRSKLKDVGEDVPSLKRKSRESSQLDVADMVKDLKALKSGGN